MRVFAFEVTSFNELFLAEFVALCRRNPGLHTLTSVLERLENSGRAGMISPVQQKVSAWLIDSTLVTIRGLPPKDPDDDNDENDEDKEDEDEEEEPAVIREPDE